MRYGYTLKDVAEHLGVHYATISRAVKRVEKRR
ncbi:MAG: helix-turn-helix domain-containing protein [Nitrospirota bacterium]